MTTMTPLRPAATATERHYTVQEIAEQWHLDESTVRRLFQDEKGVLVIGHNRLRAGKKQYTTLRIPESVMMRVYNSRLNGASK